MGWLLSIELLPSGLTTAPFEAEKLRICLDEARVELGRVYVKTGAQYFLNIAVERMMDYSPVSDKFE